jgi:hypothetical protein
MSYICLGFKVSKVFPYELGTMNKLYVTSCFAKEDFNTLKHPSIQVHKRHELSSHERYEFQVCCMSFCFRLEVRGISERGLRSKLWSSRCFVKGVSLVRGLNFVFCFKLFCC